MQSFIARQPIFDCKKKVIGYELLFREGFKNICENPDLNQASAQVITNSAMLFDLQTLLEGKLAFINATRECLLNEYASILPPESTVVEVLETIEHDEQVIAACHKLKQAGYKIAIDDVADPNQASPLMDMADIIKVDFLACKHQAQKLFAKKYARLPNCQLLAEKVEDSETFDRALKLGYKLFQGYFFARPEIISKKDIPGYKLFYMQMLQEIHRPELNIGRLEDILKRDVSLSYKLLRYINSAFFGFQVEVKSFKHAMVLLGEKGFRKWATVVVMAGMGEDKPRALLSTAIFRARFLESLAPILKIEEKSQDLFMTGMFSLIGAITNRPAPEILASIPLAESVKEALIGGGLNQYKVALDVCLAYESGLWQKFTELGQKINLTEDEIPELYLKAIEWVQNGFGSGK